MIQSLRYSRSLWQARTAVPLVIMMAALIGCAVAGTNTEMEPFSIVVLPDTQYYMQTKSPIFKQQTEWIRDHLSEYNIRFVAHEGDLTNDNGDEQWKLVDECMGVLDGVVPYSVVRGNHDMGPGGSCKDRDSEGFNTVFSPRRFEGKAWYGGHMGNDNDNNYCYFTAGGMDFMVLSLEFGPRDETLRWASEIVENNPDRRVIVVTHCYMFHDDTRVSADDRWAPGKYPTGGNNGDEMWDKFVKLHSNIFLVLSGHIHSPGYGRLTSTGDGGNTVYQLLADYQHLNYGNGWLRILRFDPVLNAIHVLTYSPYLGKYMTDEKGNLDPMNNFELYYSMTEAMAGATAGN